MNNIDLYIEELESVKVDIKDAIIAKGVTPTGGLSSYAAAINDIEGSGGGTIETDDLGVLINENGSYYYTPEGDGFTSVSVTVDVIPPPVITQEKDVTITSNGNTIVTPDEGFDGLNKVNISVEVAGGDAGKPKIYNGTIVFPWNGSLTSSKNALSTMDFSKYDWSKVYDGYYFLANLNEPGTDGWKNFEENFNGRFLSGNYMFSNITSNSTAMTTLPNIKEKMDGILTMKSMFQNNRQIRSYLAIADWDTSKCVDTSMMFADCQNATMLLFDVSSVVIADSMFSSVKQVVTIPQYNFEKLLIANNLFKHCSTVSKVSEITTSNIRFADSMFYYCSNISVMPELDWGNLRSCYSMFGYTKFTELPNMNTKNVITFGTSTSNSWLYENRSITKMGIIDCDSCINIGYVLSPNTISMTELGGFRNLGKMPSLIGCDGAYFLSKQPNLTYDSIMNVINLLYDRASAGYSVLTLKLHANHLAMLSDDDIAIATNKGWTIA